MKQQIGYLSRSLVCLRSWAWLSFIGLSLITALPVVANSGGDSGPPEGVNYIPITPALIVNYGGLGKMKYIKAELSIRAENATDAKEILHHLPLIRDRLVSILGEQTEEQIASVEGKERLRIYALSEINKALLRVEGHGDGHGEGSRSDKDKHENKKVDHATKDKDQIHVEMAAVKGPASDLFFNNFVVQK